ncbi:hypothetical protein AB4452_04630 [Vibrio lentus]
MSSNPIHRSVNIKMIEDADSPLDPSLFDLGDGYYIESARISWEVTGDTTPTIYAQYWVFKDGIKHSHIEQHEYLDTVWVTTEEGTTTGYSNQTMTLQELTELHDAINATIPVEEEQEYVHNIWENK